MVMVKAILKKVPKTIIKTEFLKARGIESVLNTNRYALKLKSFGNNPTDPPRTAVCPLKEADVICRSGSSVTAIMLSIET